MKLAPQTLFRPLVFDLFAIPNKPLPEYLGRGIPFLSTNAKVGKEIEVQKSTN